MTTANPAYTPVAQTKSAALCRVLDALPKGYHYTTAGSCPAGKAVALARKFHALYGIGCSPAQRMTRKKQGLANALLVMFWPSATLAVADSGLESESVSETASETASAFAPEAASEIGATPLPGIQVSWLLLATAGTGPVHERERLRSALEMPRLHWLGYELVRLARRGRASWTWRRTKQDMADLVALLTEQLNRRQVSAVAQTLLRISRQPGFSGVREQSWALYQLARSHGYAGELPFLFYLQKLSHGFPLRVSGD